MTMITNSSSVPLLGGDQLRALPTAQLRFGDAEQATHLRPCVSGLGAEHAHRGPVEVRLYHARDKRPSAGDERASLAADFEQFNRPFARAPCEGIL
jgi:hypothetical protein